MPVRVFLIAMTLVAVVSDYMMHPFYPLFFATRFGVTDPRITGIYFSAVCATVMIAFPIWAIVSRRIPELRILVYTQLIAGILAGSCAFITSYPWFWVVSLLVIVFKGSYLLVYPYILRITPVAKHVGIISVLSVIIHLGSVLGAIFGGMVIDWLQPRYIYLGMAAGDFFQAALSMYLLSMGKQEPAPQETASHSWFDLIPGGTMLKLSVITLLFYYADFLIRPFFVRYWESVSSSDSRILSGTIYAIPAAVAVAALYANKTRKPYNTPWHGILPALLLALCGLILQAYPAILTIIAGRCLYGWAFFQCAVRFDALLFHISDPASYAVEYSKIHFFQNLGVLAASFSAGVLAEYLPLNVPFVVAFAGYAGVVLLYYLMARTRLQTLSQY
ncbi:Predicted arabinose efflux permease, MFS family [Chitinophaga jiangningensis]|uniref:Predicted arabinose efflux permease, MFS family n=1 Tax=Chitinophaga jiangningensis TaxID=1419482 RepID=A0A1M7AQM5_9BACT|nr:MFS transporter [Chitinophaga jiangningensis]SHL44906.1 Predicted arabinose efflux permease, MFS family [Chitinophaga jiangningensis]